MRGLDGSTQGELYILQRKSYWKIMIQAEGVGLTRFTRIRVEEGGEIMFYATNIL